MALGAARVRVSLAAYRPLIPPVVATPIIVKPHPHHVPSPRARILVPSPRARILVPSPPGATPGGSHPLGPPGGSSPGSAASSAESADGLIRRLRADLAARDEGARAARRAAERGARGATVLLDESGGSPLALTGSPLAL